MLLADWLVVHDALAHAAQAVRTTPPPPFTTLGAGDAATLDAIAQRIMPTTQTPGAKEAGVIHFIDKALGSFEKDGLPEIRKGLTDVARRAAQRRRGATFAALPVAQQDAILKEIETTPFFNAMIYLTMVGMFANPSYGGNRDHTGWKLIGFDMQPKFAPPFGYYDAQRARRS